MLQSLRLEHLSHTSFFCNRGLSLNIYREYFVSAHFPIINVDKVSTFNMYSVSTFLYFRVDYLITNSLIFLKSIFEYRSSRRSTSDQSKVCIMFDDEFFNIISVTYLFKKCKLIFRLCVK